MAVNSLQSAFCHPTCSSQNLSEILMILVYWWGQWCSERVQNETKCTWLVGTEESMVWTQTGLGLNHHSPTCQLCDLGQVFNLSALQCSYLQNGGWWYLSIGFLKWLDKKQDHVQQTFSMFSQIYYLKFELFANNPECPLRAVICLSCEVQILILLQGWSERGSHLANKWTHQTFHFLSQGSVSSFI